MGMNNGYLALIGVLVMISCTNQNIQDDSFVEEAHVSSLLGDITKYVEVVDIRPIDNEIVFSSVSKMVSDEQGILYILDSRGVITSLTTDGTQGPVKLTRGRASNEYLSALDICFLDGRLCVLENTRIKVFRIDDALNCTQIDLTEIRDPVDAIAAVPDNMYYLFSAFSKSANNDKKGKGKTLRLINGDGSILSEEIPREDCTFSMNNISQSRDNTYYLRPQSSESVFYRLERTGLKPAFKVNFGDKAMPARYYYNVAGEDIGSYMMSDFNKLPMDYHDTKEYVYCRFCGSQASECSLIYSRKTKKSIAWKNNNEDSDFRIVGSDNDCFIIIPSNSDGLFGPLGQIIQPLLKDKCSDGQRAIVKVKFDF